MTAATTSILAGAIALLISAMSIVPPAEARRLGGAHVRAHVNAHRIARGVRPVHRARVAARNIRRAGRWVDGVWIVNGVAASVTVGTASNCAYYYRKWNETGRTYWRDQYSEHCG